MTNERDEQILHEASQLHSEMAWQYIRWSFAAGFAAGAFLTWWVIR